MLNIGLLIRFSSREFFTQFFPNKAKVSRTYFWLTCFFSLAMALSLVFVGAGEGLVNRFADAVLGYVEGAGVSNDMVGVQACGFENKNMLAC